MDRELEVKIEVCSTRKGLGSMLNMIQEFHQETLKAGEDVVFRRFPEKVSLERLQEALLTKTIDNVRYNLLCHFLAKSPPSELGEFLRTLNDPSSAFSAGNALESSDPTVYPPSEAGHIGGPAGKKRKLEESDVSEQPPMQEPATTTTGPRYLQTVRANEHMTQKVYGVLKKEGEELAHLTVSAPTYFFRSYRPLTLGRTKCGSG
jgi:proteasome activator subunit 3 (PA28 gamma)